MRNLRLGQRFDGIIAWHSNFHLTPEDQRTLFPMFRNHATLGEILMFTRVPSEGVAMGAFEGEPLYHAGIDPDEYRDLLDINGFDVIENAVNSRFRPETRRSGLHVIAAVPEHNKKPA